MHPVPFLAKWKLVLVDIYTNMYISNKNFFIRGAKMKKNMRIVSLILAMFSLCAFSFAGCGPKGSSNVTELRVWNYDGGVGHEWLDAVIQRFESENVDTVYEEGKKGVKIRPNNTKDTNQLNNIKNANFSVYFAQGIRYNGLQADGTLLDISDLVGATLPGESKTIESKLSDNTKAALSAQGGYYVLPHYQSFNGVVYNKTVFEEYGLYLAADTTGYKSLNENDPEYGFIKDLNCTRTVGPDGVKGSDDDGLPSSIEEFGRLLDYMVDSGVTPFIWMDGNTKSYQMALTNALWMNLEGYDGAMANFTFNSNGTKSKIVTSFNGEEPVSTEKEITKDNIWDVYQQESRYYALELSQEVFSNEAYYHEYSTSSTNSQILIQQTFLESNFTGGKPIAMLLEGSYWLNEVKTAGKYQESVESYPEIENLEFEMMPLPVIAKGSVQEGQGRRPVHLDMLSSYAFINANVVAKHGEGVAQLAKDFLAYCYTDISLAEFTAKSKVTKDVKYEISDTQYKALDSFAQSVWDAKKNDKVVVPISGEVEFVKNPSEFTMFSDLVLWKTVEGDGTNYPYTGFHSMGLTAKDYFLGMKKTSEWWSALKH